jgi:LacI family transcriptional regulator
LGVIAALREANIAVPQQVAVVGFDNMLLAQHVQPPLTTVHVPIEEVGKQGVQLLIQQINTGSVQSVRLPTQLVVRQSCGAAGQLHGGLVTH